MLLCGARLDSRDRRLGGRDSGRVPPLPGSTAVRLIVDEAQIVVDMSGTVDGTSGRLGVGGEELVVE